MSVPSSTGPFSVAVSVVYVLPRPMYAGAGGSGVGISVTSFSLYGPPYEPCRVAPESREKREDDWPRYWSRFSDIAPCPLKKYPNSVSGSCKGRMGEGRLVFRLRARMRRRRRMNRKMNAAMSRSKTAQPIAIPTIAPMGRPRCGFDVPAIVLGIAIRITATHVNAEITYGPLCPAWPVWGLTALGVAIGCLVASLSLLVLGPVGAAFGKAVTAAGAAAGSVVCVWSEDCGVDSACVVIPVGVSLGSALGDAVDDCAGAFCSGSLLLELAVATFLHAGQSFVDTVHPMGRTESRRGLRQKRDPQKTLECSQQ